MARSLETYNKKRDFAATPEPSGKPERGSKRLRFVIQKHRATRLHYDFRLEADGAMPSWAVPKGPTLVPGERRLAMHVEDHPLAYRTFEGVIPKGQYGAGEVIIWDEGWYELAEGTDPAREIANGKIKFIMHGKKMHGMFTLVKIKPKEGESGDPWLLIKDHDGNDPTHYDVDDYPESVVSGKTIEDIKKESNPKTWQSRPVDPPKKKRARAAAKAEPLPKIKGVELATLIDEPFDSDDWLFEIKWDGYRGICTVDAKGKLTLVSRNGLDLLKQFPDLAGSCRRLRERTDHRRRRDREFGFARAAPIFNVCKNTPNRDIRSPTRRLTCYMPTVATNARSRLKNARPCSNA